MWRTHPKNPNRCNCRPDSSAAPTGRVLPGQHARETVEPGAPAGRTTTRRAAGFGRYSLLRLRSGRSSRATSAHRSMHDQVRHCAAYRRVFSRLTLIGWFLLHL